MAHKIVEIIVIVLFFVSWFGSPAYFTYLLIRDGMLDTIALYPVVLMWGVLLLPFVAAFSEKWDKFMQEDDDWG